jgi:HlyD family secretion protein
MTANVTFVYAEKDEVLRVPNAALRFRPPPSLLAAGRNAGGARPGSAAAAPGGRPPGGGTRGASEPADRRTVWTLEGEQPQPKRIRIGISDGSLTEVVEGDLKAGDVVITDATGGPPSGPAAGLRRGL